MVLSGLADHGITLHYGCCGTGLGEPHWGKGITTAALKAMIEYVFAAFPYILRIEAGCFAR